MPLIVQKYGGTSLGTTDLIQRVANRIKLYYEQSFDLVITVSAMGKETDRLTELAVRINPEPNDRELDMLLSTGEQVSMALLAIALHKINVPALSFTGEQAQIFTDGRHLEAKIVGIDTAKLLESIRNRKVCIVAGFQGVDSAANITTLGRGGSDTSAVALAAALGAESCEIYTDVDGVYTTDPNKIATARKIPQISYEEMMELARLGAAVLNNRSVEMALRYNVELHVRSSFNNNPGTMVVAEEKIMEKAIVRGVSLKTDESRISVIDIPDRPGLAARLFGRLSEANVNVDVIVQSSGKDGMNTISFTLPKNSLLMARQLMDEFVKEMGAGSYEADEQIAIVSVVGVGMRSHSGIAAEMFKALADNNINIEMISTSEIKISVVVQTEQGQNALEAIHRCFKLDIENIEK